MGFFSVPRMFLGKSFFCILTIFLFLFNLAIPVDASDVYYLGTTQSATVASVTAQSFTFKERLSDLFDFRDYGKYTDERSGVIGGRFLAEVNWQNVSGNKNKSFYAAEDVDYKTELNLNFRERLINDYSFEGELFLRKTDNNRIDVRQDIRLKQLSMKITNGKNRFDFGDMYADFSPFVLSDSFEGFRSVYSVGDAQVYQAIVGRSYNADSTTNLYQRNIFGGKADWMLFANSGLFNLFRIGLQAVTIQDDSSSAPEATSTVDIDNTIISLDGEIRFKRYLSLNYEVARSGYVADDDATVSDRQQGLALRIMPGLRFSDNKVSLKYLYYYVQPEFYTATGSASRDKQQHQFSLDWRLNSKATFSLVENLYWDHLESSSSSKRTVYDEKYITLNLHPLDKRQNLSLRTYLNHLNKKSDDPTNSVEAITDTVGFALNDRVWGASVNAFYEYRSYDDKATPGNSDYFNRFGCGLSRDWNIFKRRLYLSANYSTDIRNTKSDLNKDVNSGIIMSGSYDLSKKVILRFGHNIQESNNARPTSDYTNNKSYMEFDYLLQKKRGAHIIIRGDYNRYNHEDGTQDYNETVISGRFVSNF